MKIVVRLDSINKTQTVAAPVRSFEKLEVTVGRGPDNDLVLADPKVSTRHLKFHIKDDSLNCTDLGSSNGTYLESQRLVPNLPTSVGHGQRIVLGGYILTPTLEGLAEQKPLAAAQTEVLQPKEALKQIPGESLFEKETTIKRQIHDLLIDRLDLRRREINKLSDDELRARAERVVETILVDLRWNIPEGLDRAALIKQVLDEALGLGPLEELLAKNDCSEIMVNRYDQIYAEFHGRLELTSLRFSSEQAVLAAIERILAPIGRRIDESSPLVDARLKDGSRVNAVIRPLALHGPCITIRKFAREPLKIEDLVKYGSLSSGMSGFLKLAVENRLNIVISGGTGSGKTTLLNIIAGFVPVKQRVITVEDAAELRLPQEHVVSFETRPPNLEGKGAISIRDLVRNALRMRPDRIIVGECRGAEALDMLQAMNTGHDGSMTTGHANSPQDMIRRLETMVLTAGLDLPVRAIREQIASAVNIIVQQNRFADGSRRITAITEVVGMDYDEGTVILQDIFVFKQHGFDEQGRVQGVHQATGYVPKFFRALQDRGQAVDARVFAPGNAI